MATTTLKVNQILQAKAVGEPSIKIKYIDTVNDIYFYVYTESGVDDLSVECSNLANITLLYKVPFELVALMDEYRELPLVNGQKSPRMLEIITIIQANLR